jgi:hypothetical protein
MAAVSPQYDPLMPCFTEPDPGPSLLDQARALAAETRALAAALRLRRAAVDEAELIVAEREGSRA